MLNYQVRGIISGGALAAVGAASTQVLAHGITGSDAAFLATANGPQIVPFLYLGAKHMVTGIDHLLFILGVIFFLYRPSHVAVYVTMFTVGHSITFLAGVLIGVSINSHLIDAVIGLSVVYKALDNLGTFQTLFGITSNSKLAVLIFGLFHGLGLATRLQELSVSRDGLVANMISFNVGVELGQLLALFVMLAVIFWWRRSLNFDRDAIVVNFLILVGGFSLVQYQLVAFFMQTGA